MAPFDIRISRRALLRRGSLGVAGAGALLIVGCGDDDDGDASPTPMPTAVMTTTPTSISLVSGWYRDAPVRYYDFGMRSPVNGNVVVPAPIWVLITGMDGQGNPVFVEGQHNVIDAVPGDTGYSDLWEVRLVTVPANYAPDTIRSRSDVEAAGYAIVSPGLFVNCPVVEKPSVLEGGEALVQGWYRGEEVYYPDFGPNPATAIPIWAFITGTDAGGNPQFVAGQNNVIDSVPDDTGYSAFWRVSLVTVGAGYEANAIKSAADIASSGFAVMETTLVVNCPVVEF